MAAPGGLSRPVTGAAVAAAEPTDIVANDESLPAARADEQPISDVSVLEAALVGAPNPETTTASADSSAPMPIGEPEATVDISKGAAIAMKAFAGPERPKPVAPSMKAEPKEPVIDELWISLAKAGFKDQGGSRLSAQANKDYMDGVRIHILCQIVIHFADDGALTEAEAYMKKLDAQQNRPPEITAVNALIRAYNAAGEYALAEEWFQKATHPAPHPELGDLRANNGTFHYVIVPAAERGDMAQAENYMRQMELFQMRPSLSIYSAIIRSCIRSGPPHTRRGHRWCEELCLKGCSDFESSPDLSTKSVKQLRSLYAMMDTGYIHSPLWSFDKIIQDLVKALVDAGYSRSADKWLEFLVDTGFSASDAPETWEHVRAHHPKDIIPALLSGEAHHVGNASSPRKGAPSLAVPARLAGETAPGGHLQPVAPSSVTSRLANGEATNLSAPPSARMKALREAISHASEVGLSDTELKKYKMELDSEERARISLIRVHQLVCRANEPEIVDSQVLAELKEAISDAEAARLDKGDLREAREVLEREEGKARARHRLEEAMRKREAAALHLPDLSPQDSPGRAVAPGGSSKVCPKVMGRARRRAADLKQSARILYV